jgi:hypothetical protein
MEADQQAATISPAGTFASHVPYVTWVMMDLVDRGRSPHRSPG